MDEGTRSSAVVENNCRVRLEEWEASDPERADEIVCYSDEQYQTHFTVLLAQLQTNRILDERSLRPCASTSEGSGMIGALRYRATQESGSRSSCHLGFFLASVMLV